MCYLLSVIRSFADATTRDIWNGADTKAARRIDKRLWPVIQRKLDLLDTVERVEHLRLPPGNRLEALKGERAGRYSLRVNDQYRLTFTFADGHADYGRCEDYH
jgi:proteic killer suppression protein